MLAEPLPDRPDTADREATAARRDAMFTSADRFRALIAAESRRNTPDPLGRLQRRLREVSELVAEVMAAGATTAQVVGAVRRGIAEPDPIRQMRGCAARNGQP